MKQEVFFIIFKGLSPEVNNRIFLEGESPTFNVLEESLSDKNVYGSLVEFFIGSVL